MNMRAPAISSGDPNGVLRLGPTGIAGDRISQTDSDLLAHFIQVENLIRASSWLDQKCEFASIGGTMTSEFPDLESFVYVAIYFRQLMSQDDDVFRRACDVYIRNTSSDIKRWWLLREKKAALKVWKAPACWVTTYSVERLFSAMIYGAHIFHSKKATKNQQQVNDFRDILQKHSREQLLFGLHGSLRELACNHLSVASVVIHQDYSFWVNEGWAPSPDVVWHGALFNGPDKARGRAVDAPPEST